MLRLRFYGEKLNFSLSLSHLFSYLRPRICFTFTTVFEIFLILLCFAAKPTTWTENKNTNTKWAPGRAPPPSPPPPPEGEPHLLALRESHDRGSDPVPGVVGDHVGAAILRAEAPRVSRPSRHPAPPQDSPPWLTPGRERRWPRPTPSSRRGPPSPPREPRRRRGRGGGGGDQPFIPSPYRRRRRHR